MIWATEPPTPEMVGDALVIADVLMIERNHVERGVNRPDRTQEIHELYGRVMLEATRQYLRLYPMAKAFDGVRYIEKRSRKFFDVTRAIEADFICIICRRSIQTLTRNWDKRDSQLPAAFYRNLYSHADLCAARFLAQQIQAIGPRPDERVPAVSSLTGRPLIRYAKDAAYYLGEDEPKARYAKDEPMMIAGGKGPWLRRFVTRARRAARERSVWAHGEAAWSPA